MRRIDRRLRQHYRHKHLHYHSPRIRRRKKRENLFEEITTEHVPTMAKKTVTQVQDAPSTKRNESEESHTKTHYNLKSKNKSKTLKSTKRKTSYV